MSTTEETSDQEHEATVEATEHSEGEVTATVEVATGGEAGNDEQAGDAGDVESGDEGAGSEEKVAMEKAPAFGRRPESDVETTSPEGEGSATDLSSSDVGPEDVPGDAAGPSGPDARARTEAASEDREFPGPSASREEEEVTSAEPPPQVRGSSSQQRGRGASGRAAGPSVSVPGGR